VVTRGPIAQDSMSLENEISDRRDPDASSSFHELAEPRTANVKICAPERGTARTPESQKAQESHPTKFEAVLTVCSVSYLAIRAAEKIECKLQPSQNSPAGYP